MKTRNVNQLRGPAPWALAVVVGVLMLAGCAAQREHDRAMALLDKGQPVTGIESLRRAVELDPSNVQYQIDAATKQKQVVDQLLAQAERQLAAGQWSPAAETCLTVLQVEPHNSRARAGLARIELERRSAEQLDQADKLLRAGKADAALELSRAVVRELPGNVRAQQLRQAAEERIESDRLTRDEQLAGKAALRRPVSLSFRDTPLKLILEALSRVAAINIVVDKDVKTDTRTTIFVKDAPIEDTIDVLLLQNQLEKRVLNGNTILIYPATAAKQKELAELKVRSFQLSNIDPALMANIIKTMIRTKDIVTDPKSGTLVMRDTAEAIALAERLVAANDLPAAEVMLEVNVMEISSSRATDLGVKLPTSIGFSTPTDTNGNLLDARTLRQLNGGDLLVSPLSASINLMLQDSDTKLLARPHIRARSGEKARILVGDKLPQITNMLSPQQNGQNSVLTGSIQYVDVGIKLEIQPDVYTDGDVGIQLALEVSNVTDTVQTQSGRAYQIGTRSAQTSLRLHDGETQILGGLISDRDRLSAQKIPGLGNLPMVGQLFGNNGGDKSASEIVVSITPRIIRPRAQPDLRDADAWSGSEASVRDRPLRLESVGALKVNPPAGSAAAAPGATSGNGPYVAPPRPMTPAPAGATPAAAPASAPGVAPSPATTAPAPVTPGASTPTATAPAASTVPPAPAATPVTAPSYVPTVVPRAAPQRVARPAEPAASAAE